MFRTAGVGVASRFSEAHIPRMNCRLPARLAALTLGLSLTGFSTPASARATTMTTPSLSLPDPPTTAAWAERREQLRREWLDILGPFPPRPDLEAQVLRTEKELDHDRLLVTYQTEPGQWTDAYLLIPHRRAGRAPAAVVFHATTSRHILQPVGLATSSTRHLALHLVRRGFVTLSPRCFIYGPADSSPATGPAHPERGVRDYAAESEKLLQRAPGWTGMGKMLWDGMRAVDFLLTRPEVDPERIACVGHSLGAKETLYLAAFDSRIRAAVFSEGGVGLRHTNWDAVWYLGSRIPDAKLGRDHHELLALMAPRPFMIIGGGDADGEHTRLLVETARPVWQLYGRPDALVLLLHDRGHDLPDDVRERAYDWLEDMMGRRRNN